ncbi:hypothetical protein [Mesobacillus subterraneus]|uniref:Uncharacterized protein n=1 Tax=Mesobacillus subterraneus TaxID=285983 RepID=A0A3R9DWP4_9BACI|nr:hypothetical protein [Mesobacillus subterraneus]RSD29092.1 hypothetical protein EJA10_03005 [Mesobacillus subterraneus]
MGWNMANRTDFSGFQMEKAFLFTIFIVMSIWVYYDSDKYLIGYKKHLFWVATIFTGPIGLGLWLYWRRRLMY